MKGAEAEAEAAAAADGSDRRLFVVLAAATRTRATVATVIGIKKRAWHVLASWPNMCACVCVCQIEA